MQPFQLHIPTRIIFGKGSLSAVGDSTKPLGDSAMVVIGGGSVERSGALHTVLDSLGHADITTHVFRGIEPNPHHDTVNRAAREASEENVNVIVALGGGSVMDAAKGIAAMTLKESGDCDVWDYVLGGSKRDRLDAALPIVAVPTTAATASEVTPYAVISNVDLPGKAPLSHECLKPTIAVMDPALTHTVSAATTADGGADIISHVLENYLLGGNDSPFADRHSEAVMLTVIENLPIALREPEHAEARANLFWASTLALSGLQGAGRTPSEFILHAIEHAMSAYQPALSHGRGLATLFLPYLRWLLAHHRAMERLDQLGDRLFNLRDAEAFIERFNDWLSQVGLRQSAVECGLAASQFQAVADYACRTYGTDGVMNALGPMTPRDVVAILEDS
ncbi:MAG: iron-containing alcohol dehydrogenase [Phycisphaerales bacterium]|nr:iron-containing alcohol dehydrogenase [Phycisphaerales bacterium]